MGCSNKKPKKLMNAIYQICFGLVYYFRRFLPEVAFSLSEVRHLIIFVALKLTFTFPSIVMLALL